MGWSSGYAAWGGYIKIKPVNWYYAQAGLFLAIPNANNTANHVLDFPGARPDRNGLYFIAETGVTRRIGPSQLPGKYVFGGYYWGLENTSFFGQPFDGKFGFYWQADQMLWREPSPQVVEEKSADGKAIKAPSTTSKPKLNDQGLRWFSFFNFAPAYNNAMPFYFHTLA